MHTYIQTDRPTSESAGTNRRTFLMAGGAVLAGAVLLRRDLGPTNGGLSALVAAAGPRIGVGFVEGSAGARSLADALATGSRRAVAASTLRSGGLSNQAAALSVHGFTPGISADACCTYDTVLVDAHIPSPDPYAKDATIPFYAWTFRRTPLAMASGRSRFVIAKSRGLRVGFSVDSGNGPASVVFTSGSERQLPKLQRGVYLLGLEAGAWQQPHALPKIDDPAWSGLASMVVVVDAM